MDSVEAAVVGGGVVGLAIARALALAGREVVILEAESAIGTHASSRSNEVLHAGFLHPADSLKARLCRRGRDLALRYCRERGVAVLVVGKLMPALSQAERGELEALRHRGLECGVEDLEILGGADAAAREPALHCVAALLSPSTAIVDVHAFMLALEGDAEAHGAVLSLASPVASVRRATGKFVLEVHQPDSAAYQLECGILVNAAGLGARLLGESIPDYPATNLPQVSYAKGSFFALQGRAPFSRLIVPLGDTLAMGGAFTIDLAGRGRFGGDIEWVDRIDYRVDSARRPSFVEAIRRYWPGIDPERLSPGYSGVRPRCWGPGDRPGDWIITGPGQHGIPGLVQLLGIETPGLTAALAIADHVLELLDDRATRGASMI